MNPVSILELISNTFTIQTMKGCKGVCNCERKRNGKGNGIDTCRRVTIAVFNSGKIIITGAMNRDQLVEWLQFHK